MPQPRTGAELYQKLLQYRAVFGWRGVWLALRTKLTRAARTERARVPNSHREVEIRLNGPELETFAKIFLHREYETPLAKEPKVIIDAGANVGYATVFFSIAFPRAKIIAIEPEPENFAILKRNTSALPNVVLLQGALWNTSGHVNLMDPGMGSWGFEVSNATQALPSIPTLGQVRAFTVPEIMQTCQMDYIDILKVDIEGGEKMLFADCPHWVGQVGVIMIELHDNRQPGCSTNFNLATRDFDKEIRKGENVFKLRRDYVPT